MASIVVVEIWYPKNFVSEEYFAQMGQAKSRVKQILREVKKRYGPVSYKGQTGVLPVLAIQRWNVKTSKANLVLALQVGKVYCDPNDREDVECWTLDNDGKLYKWDGAIHDDPDLKVGQRK